MKPHIRKVRGIWTVRMCIRVHGRLHGPLGGPIGHGYTVREACEDWKAQMKGRA